MEYLENVRWHGLVTCPYCGSEKTCRHVSGDRRNQRWQCQRCTKAFSATVGTIFHGTHVSLRNWFLVIALMLNAKKSVSACQIARDIGMRRPTVWSMMHRIRRAMAKDKKQRELLFGIVEADETYIGGKPRRYNEKRNQPKGGNKSKRGRGTDKTAVIGAVERNGSVVAEPIIGGKVNRIALSTFIRKYIDSAISVIMSDEFPTYRHVCRGTYHSSVNHKERYVEGSTHINTIEGFWALLKRAWYGQHHHYSRKYIDLYVSEACYKYNARHKGSMFHETIALMVGA